MNNEAQKQDVKAEGLKLTAVQARMLAGAFYIDGWHNRDHLNDADDLAKRGLLSRRVSEESQRTSYHYEPTEAGRLALPPTSTTGG